MLLPQKYAWRTLNIKMREKWAYYDLTSGKNGARFNKEIKGEEISAVKQQQNELQKKRCPKRTHTRMELSEGLYLHLDKKSKSLQPVINLLLNGSSSSGVYNKRRKKEKLTP